MPAITVVNTSTGGHATSGTSHSLAVPPGTLDGDVLLTFVGNDAGTAGTFTAPGGWSLVRDDNDASGFTQRVRCYRRVASSEPASYTWTVSGGVATVSACIALRSAATSLGSGGVDTSTGNQDNSADAVV